MKKLLRIIFILLLLGLGFLYIVKNPELPISQKILSVLGMQKTMTPNEKRLSEQTGDIFTVENFPYIQELTETSSGKLAKYIQEYINENRILLSGGDTRCQNNTQDFFLGDNFVCFKNNIIHYQDSLGNLGSGNKQNLKTFIDAFNTILASIGPLSLSLLVDDMSILEMSIGGNFNADPKTFAILDDQYAKDAKKVYIYNIKNGSISQIYLGDPATFTPLSVSGTFFTAKDKNNVYHGDQIISGVDAKSIKLLPGGYAIDTNHVYYYGNTISGADLKTFTVITSGDQLLGKDSNRMYIGGINLNEYQKDMDMQDSNLMINEEHDPEVTGEAYRIQRDLPKIPDFIIEDVEVNANNIAKTTDTTVTLRLTISNVGGAPVLSKKVDYLHLVCTAEIGNGDTNLFSISKDINNINGGKDLQPNERFTVDIQGPAKYYGLIGSPEQASCFLYNYYIDEISKTNDAYFSFTVTK